MACQRRFERPTDGLEVRCSILLSYWHMAAHGNAYTSFAPYEYTVSRACCQCGFLGGFDGMRIRCRFQLYIAMDGSMRFPPGYKESHAQMKSRNFCSSTRFAGCCTAINDQVAGGIA